MMNKSFKKYCVSLFLAVGLVGGIIGLGGCSLTGDDVVDLDFRGDWILFAQHQTEAELNIRYAFTLTQNDDHSFSAEARQFLLDMPIWTESVIVEGRIAFDGNDIQIEFDYPESGNGPEIAHVTFLRKSTESPLVVVTGVTYAGESVGLVAPGGGILPYDTDIVIMEQTAQ
jgi:hypothetical protein